MADMLVRLYDLPAHADAVQRLAAAGVSIRRPNVWDVAPLLAWVGDHFHAAWVAECEVAAKRRSPTCFVAVGPSGPSGTGGLLGFACFDATRLNFFGPTAVLESARGQGIGTALLLACLQAMRDNGYAYAIIGGVGPAEYYAKTVGAVPIAGSTPGIYDFALSRR